MSIIKLIKLVGTREAKLQARGILENHPNVKRIDTLENKSDIRLILSKSIREEELAGILAETGLIGVRIGSCK